MAYLSAASLVPGRVDIQQVGDAQQTVVAPAQVATHRRHRVQRTGWADRISTHQRRVRTVLVAAATAVQRGPLHFGDEQRLHERAGLDVQTVQRSELGLVTAENMATTAATASASGCGTAAVTVAAVATIVASMTVIVVVAATDCRRATAAVVAVSGRHRSATVAATPVQVAKGRGSTPAQVAGHPSAFLRLARRRRHRTISLLLLLLMLLLLLLWVVLTLTASSSLSSSSSSLPLTGHTGCSVHTRATLYFPWFSFNCIIILSISSTSTTQSSSSIIIIVNNDITSLV